MKLTLTQAGTLVLTATIVDGSEDAAGNLSDYVQDFSFTVDRAPVSGGVGFGDGASIAVYANGGAEPLSAEAVIPVPRDTEYYIEVDPSYSNVVWFLNGNRSTVSGGKLYLDTARAGPVEVTVEAELGGVRDDTLYTFIIK